jgi:peroxiredoxin
MDGASGKGIFSRKEVAMALTEGQKAPDFTLPVKFKMPQPDTISLSSYQGKQNALLLFYVLDWSPG